MLKHLKFNGPDDFFWFTSDTHFNHKSFVYGPRGFKSAQAHDDDLIHRWNARVKNTDTVFFLGDFVLSVNKSESAMQYIRRLNFANLIMVAGNHNAGVRQLYEEELKSQYNLDNVEVYPLIKNLGNRRITFVGTYLESYINNQHIVMNHFSLRNWNKNGKGSWCLVGHSHGNDSGINAEDESRKILDVGVDRFPNLINFREVKQIMARKNIEIVDHHGTDPVEE